MVGYQLDGVPVPHTFFNAFRLNIELSQISSLISSTIAAMENPTMAMTLQQYCDLPENIHPILAREKWAHENFDKDVALWQRIQPSLRFATQMLTSDPAILWWTHLIYGKLFHDTLHDCWYLERTNRSFSVTALDDARKFLSENAARLIKLSFRGRTEYGRTQFTLGELIEISVNVCFRDYFAAGDHSATQDVYTRFLLSVTIVHEIAHAVYAMREMSEFAELKLHRDANSGHHHDEPYFTKGDAIRLEPKLRAELGWRLELYLLDLTFYAHMSSRHGAAWMFHGSMFHAQEPTGYEYTPWLSLVAFFQKKKWDDISKRWDVDPAEQVLPTLQCRYGNSGEIAIVYVPTALLINQSDGLFTRENLSRYQRDVVPGSSRPAYSSRPRSEGSAIDTHNRTNIFSASQNAVCNVIDTNIHHRPKSPS
jgi:hypothetical protein